MVRRSGTIGRWARLAAAASLVLAAACGGSSGTKSAPPDPDVVGPGISAGNVTFLNSCAVPLSFHSSGPAVRTPSSAASSLGCSASSSPRTWTVTRPTAVTSAGHSSMSASPIWNACWHRPRNGTTRHDEIIDGGSASIAYTVSQYRSTGSGTLRTRACSSLCTLKPAARCLRNALYSSPSISSVRCDRSGTAIMKSRSWKRCSSVTVPRA